jgi:hypothetical protein
MATTHIFSRKHLVIAGVIVGVPILCVACYAYLQFDSQFLPAYGKGGIGLIENETYVFTKTTDNEMSCGGALWKGHPRPDREMVTCRGSTITGFDLADVQKNDYIVRFTPKHIHIYNLKAMSAGYYIRGGDEQPAPNS